MEPCTIRGLDLDRCTGCRSVWFDDGELETYLANDPARSGGAVPRHEDLDSVRHNTEHRCPRSNEPGLFLGSILGVEFLKCRRCSGILLPEENQHTLAARVLWGWPPPSDELSPMWRCIHFIWKLAAILLAWKLPNLLDP